MRRHLAPLAAALVLCAAAATPSFALCPWTCPEPGPWLPNFSQSTVPPQLRVMGYGGNGEIDPAGTFTIVLRDLAGLPVAGALVRFEFAGCEPATICAASSTTCDSLALAPPDPRVFAVSGPDGVVSLRFAGTANNPGGGPASGDGRVLIYACGTIVAHVPVAFFDMDGGDGIGANDLSAWLADFFVSANHPRGDYDNSGSLGANDLSLWLLAAGTGGSVLGCANHP